MEVVWTDSGTQSSAGWQDKAYYLENCRIGIVQSVGFVMHEDDETLYLAQAYDPDHENYYNVAAIHKANISKMKFLRER